MDRSRSLVTAAAVATGLLAPLVTTAPTSAAQAKPAAKVVRAVHLHRDVRGRRDGLRLTATTRDLDAAEAWSVEASPRAPYSCSADPSGPQGCFDNGFAVISGIRSSATSFFALRAPVAVAMPAAGTTGTVSLRLLTAP